MPSCSAVSRRARARRSAALLTLVALVVAACSAGGSEERVAPTTTTTGSTTTTTTTEATTTTLSEEERALEAMGDFTSQEQAEFRLFTHPPEFPGPLPALTTPLEPISDPVLIVRANPDTSPVVGPDRQYVTAHVRYDALGRLLWAADGRVLDDGGVEIPSDDLGPIVLPVLLDDAGAPRYEDPPPTPPTTKPGATPAPRKLLFERRLLVPANRLLAVGDSVLLGTQGTLPAATGRWKTLLDARESRLPGDGDNVIRAHDDIGRVVIVMLGHNVGPGEQHRANIEAIQAALDERPVVDRVIWVTAAEIGPGQLEWNEALRQFVADRREGGDPETHLLDWALFNAAHPEYTDDGLHLTLVGRAALTDLLTRFVGPAPDCDRIIGDGPTAGACL
jgi:hypothetical protein